jgi:hypothetical protein
VPERTFKKLVEVSMPMDEINRACAREKSIRHGHPSTLHLYWARRPLAGARAVIFGQMVDDPSSWPECFPTKEAQDAERERLHDVIRRFVPWEATTNDEIMEEARTEIWRSWQRFCDWRLSQQIGGLAAYREVLTDWWQRRGRVGSRESFPPDKRVFGISDDAARTIARSVFGFSDAGPESPRG